MNYKKSESTVYCSDGIDGPHQCEVVIDDLGISISSKIDGIFYVYKGGENSKGCGHFDLQCAELGGKASMHRAPGSLFLEGFFKESGGSGMWRIQLKE